MLQYVCQTQRATRSSCQRACSSRSFQEPGCANNRVFYLLRYPIFVLVAMIIARYFSPFFDFVLRIVTLVLVVMTTILRLPEHILLS